MDTKAQEIAKLRREMKNLKGHGDATQRKLDQQRRNLRVAFWDIFTNLVFGEQVTEKLRPILEKKIAGVPYEVEESASQFKSDDLAKFLHAFRLDYSKLASGGGPAAARKKRFMRLLVEHLSD